MKSEPLLYFRTNDQIKEYQNLPARQKLKWLEAQMKFFHKAMPEKAKKIREKLKKGEL
jgi:hypothetical protein